jgi:hypothetical protein
MAEVGELEPTHGIAVGIQDAGDDLDLQYGQVDVPA